MIYSRSAGHAIRAFVHMAQLGDGRYAMVKQIAEDEGIPAPFLAKILQQLARKGMLRSSKGPIKRLRATRLLRARFSLLHIVQALDGVPACCQCPMGLADCHDEVPCAMHDSWLGLRSRIMEYLERNTVADLAAALEKKKRAKPAGTRKAKRASAASKRV